MKKTILLTGCAGFIGFHTAKKLLNDGHRVVGVDNINTYYDVSLKDARLNILKRYENFVFYKKDISEELDFEEKIDVICHLAAQAGVRYSIEDPLVYETSNNLGTLRIFEYARHNNIAKVVFASSSSVYGNCEEEPFKETFQLDKPISLYAATKKNNELTAYSYHHLFGIKMVGLRFFTVYGPYGRPDMALFKFTKNILENKEIDVYNNGELYRDFTYIDDIVQGVTNAIHTELDFEIINLARGETIKLTKFIKAIEKATNKKAKKNNKEMQPGDVNKTSGDITKARKLLNYEPKTSIEEGVQRFVDWYKEYYNI